MVLEDDKFGFQNSLDGNIDNWQKGRKDPDGELWLSKYQGNDFSRRRVNRNNIFLTLYRYITYLPRGMKHIWRKLFSRHR